RRGVLNELGQQLVARVDSDNGPEPHVCQGQRLRAGTAPQIDSNRVSGGARRIDAQPFQIPVILGSELFYVATEHPAVVVRQKIAIVHSLICHPTNISTEINAATL